MDEGFWNRLNEVSVDKELRVVKGDEVLQGWDERKIEADQLIFVGEGEVHLPDLGAPEVVQFLSHAKVQ